MNDPQMLGPGDLPILSFEVPEQWIAWLAANADTSPGIWMRLARKGAPLRTISNPEALDAALCYGWIDSHKKAFDEISWIQRFSRRSRRSVWSRINRDHIERLTAEGRMRPAGLRAVEEAKADGRWEAAYPSQRNASVPPDLQAELDQRPTAAEFFASLDSANRYAVIFRVATARKPETRAARIARFVEMLERGEKLHP